MRHAETPTHKHTHTNIFRRFAPSIRLRLAFFSLLFAFRRFHFARFPFFCARRYWVCFRLCVILWRKREQTENGRRKSAIKVPCFCVWFSAWKREWLRIPRISNKYRCAVVKPSQCALCVCDVRPYWQTYLHSRKHFRFFLPFYICLTYTLYQSEKSVNARGHSAHTHLVGLLYWAERSTG